MPVVTPRAHGVSVDRSPIRRRTRSAMLLLASAAASANAQLVNSEWNAGSGSWNLATNWFPNDVPDNGGGLTYNVLIGNRVVATGAAVTFVPEDGTADTVSTLTISNGADLFTNGNQLNILNLTTLDGVGSTIRVDAHTTPTTAALTSLNLTLNNGGGLMMSGGIAAISTQLQINAGSVVGGHGTITLGDNDVVVEQAFENSGLLQTQSNTAGAQVLTLQTNGVDTIDLDGDSEVGVVDVSNALANANADTCTLVINGPLADSFGGLAGASIQIGQRDTLTFNQDFQISAGAAIDLNGGTQTATLNGAGAITSIAGATFTVAGSAVIDNDMTFTGTANVLSVAASSTLTLNGTVTIPDASMIAFAASSSSLVIGGSTAITELAGDFNWDGPGTATTTVNGTGALTVNVNRVDTGDDIFGGTLNLDDNADVSVNTAANSWTMAGTLNKRNAGSSVVAGDTMTVTGAIDVSAGALTTPVTTFTNTSNTTVDGLLVAGASSILAGGAFSGSGTLRMAGISTVTANTTIGVTTFDWDGTTTGTTHTINSGVIFTINSTTFDSDGDMDDPLIMDAGASLLVNGASGWTMNGVMTVNTSLVGASTLGGTSRMSLGNTLTAGGTVVLDAPVTLLSAGSVNISGAGSVLRLSGGTLGAPNLMSGATITGTGTLAADTSTALHGSGTISTPIDFDGTATLKAESGTLTLASTLVDVGTIGTSNGTSTLNVVNAWNSSVATNVTLSGGTLSGGTITVGNATGITGDGLVLAPVSNSSRLNATTGTLIFDNANSDWDGAANNGSLLAAASRTLELRDNATFPFLGTVSAASGATVMTTGFALNFGATSTLTLDNGTFSSTSSTALNGTLTVNAGAGSYLKVQNNFFLTFEPTSKTTLNADLRLLNNNIIVEAGATFSGTGAVIIPDGSHMVLNANSIVNTLLINDGAIRPGNSEGIGRAEALEYQQGNTGEVFFEISGTALNQFDRLVMTGSAQLDGYLSIDIDGGFVPVLGNTFNILTATTGVFGTFDYYDTSGMPAGLAFHVAYLANAVQLQVVPKPNFSADFDDDGDVDLTDYQIWKGAFNLNQLGDANGDNITDLRDFTIWSDQQGAMPGPLPGTYIPEPTTGGILALAAGWLGVGRRNRRKVGASLFAGLLGLLTTLLPATTSVAAPTLSVLNNGTVGGNRHWLVQVSPDPALFGGGKGSVAVELAFEIEGTELLSASVNSPSFPYDNPTDFNPFPGGGDFGIQTNTVTDTVFIPVGSNPFFSGAAVTVATIVTQGTGRGVLCWGGHVINANGGTFTGSRMAQAGTHFNGFKGTLPVGSVAGDADVNGKVNTLDFNRLAGNFGGAGNKDWGDGDFNQDNIVNSSDFVLLVSNYGVSIPAPAPLAGSVVPEPASLALLPILWACISRRFRFTH